MIVDVKDKDCIYWNWKVYLNGKEVNRCIYADSEEGFVMVADWNKKDKDYDYNRIDAEVRIEWIGD